MAIVDRDLLSDHYKAQYDRAMEPNDPFTYDARKHEMQGIFERLENDHKKIQWYKGKIKAGHGAIEDGDCYVSWLNFCPITVVATPLEHRRYAELDQPVFSYSYRFIIGGHMSGSSDTLAGAVQEAMVRALDCDQRDSDSEWLRGRNGSKSGTNGFLEFHEADRENPMTLSDFLTEEFITPKKVTEGPYAEQDEEASAPKM